MGEIKKLKPFMCFNHGAVTESRAREWVRNPEKAAARKKPMMADIRKEEKPRKQG